jgi:hypothetical protein
MEHCRMHGSQYSIDMGLVMDIEIYKPHMNITTSIEDKFVYYCAHKEQHLTSSDIQGLGSGGAVGSHGR